MASQQQAIRRRYSVADRLPAHLVNSTTSNSNPETAPDSTISATSTPAVAIAASIDPRFAPVRDLSQGSNPRHQNSSSHSHHGSMSSTSAMPPPSTPRDDSVPFRPGHSRARSSVSSMNRQVNRLSLTLPIAPPTSDPSRPTPTSSAMSSVPPTPIDSGIASPADASEFIIAIAAQERRVLELREELLRAEAELTSLKKKWTTQEKKGDPIPFEAYRSPVLPSEDDGASVRRSAESDRRKLLQQTQAPATPNRRRVLRGGHTRTLSLLSPAKPDAGFSLYSDRDHEHEQVVLPSIERRTAQLTNPHLSKRASWQPRSQQSGPVVPQIVEDFKLGLRAFVEDIRQITVGDEPINGQVARSNGVSENARTQDTIRPNRPLRPKVSTVFEPPHNSSETAEKTETKLSTSTATTSKSRPEMPARSKTKSKTKTFSWQPLGFDSMDDNDWSNWDSPASSSKTSRWSGSTIGSGGLDNMSATSDEGETADQDSPSKKKSTGYETPLLSPKLEELLPSLVNQFSPSNIKRTATNLMDEWEKSLTDPNYPHQSQNKENTA
ncbi:hypothetical protein FGRMN_4587 [Fusarium graminum]|nr:hypothetical protein FGRMN_4587 [Fusarium graminum]